ncbi:PREDICTED: zinc finger MYM-type protein 1-like [Prunus mume]|uniref:Zinc finger MYM-type protein 1-like n=1 Tax=Prunus mume TaxID=102107 RepID=A0ABM0PV52_PRUMU|nr:PREDICTED: zinc finger MYM-type protein 1-like [Prunus mume]
MGARSAQYRAMAESILGCDRPGATRWGSHYDYVSNLIDMYNASCLVVETLIKDGATNSICGEATGTFKAITSFEFIFVLHLSEKIMGVIDGLCQALQNKSKDILIAMNLIRSTKNVLKKLILDGWDIFFEEVESFCKKHDIDMSDMNALYKIGTCHSCQQRDDITVEHHYWVDLFNDTIDYQLEELNTRFSEGTIDLLTLSSALDPSNEFKAFKIDDICKLAEKIYPGDFTSKDLRLLRYQLELFESKMEDEYLTDSLIVCIEKELSLDIDSDSIITYFEKLKERRILLH